MEEKWRVLIDKKKSFRYNFIRVYERGGDSVKKENDMQEKAYWIIGFALVIFLILLAGSLIGLKITRDKVNQIVEKSGLIQNTKIEGNLNYTVWEDGTRENISQNVVGAEIEVEGTKFSSFSILDREETDSGDSIISGTIRFAVENTTSGEMPEKTYLMTLLDDKDEIITEFSLQTKELAAKERKEISHLLYNIACAETEKIEVKELHLGLE